MPYSDSGKPRVMVLYGSGENCHEETLEGYIRANGKADKILYDAFLQSPRILREFSILDIPGGFLDGDDLGSAQAMAFRFRNDGYAIDRFSKNDYVMEEIDRHIRKGGLIKGACNGFQFLVKSGILPGFDGNYRDKCTTLTSNDSGRFEDRWVWLEIDGSGRCPWTEGIRHTELPVRHGEGKLVPRDEEILKRLRKEGLIIGRYVGRNGEKNPGYSYNPNGSVDDIAMICDPTGQVLGMMPHPEAFLKGTNHPRWTREKLPEEGAGLQFFRNGVEYAKRNL